MTTLLILLIIIGLSIMVAGALMQRKPRVTTIETKKVEKDDDA
jgi:hypothetical protein